jgi:hypothetical protein
MLHRICTQHSVVAWQVGRRCCSSGTVRCSFWATRCAWRRAGYCTALLLGSDRRLEVEGEVIHCCKESPTGARIEGKKITSERCKGIDAIPSAILALNDTLLNPYALLKSEE